MVKPRPWFRMGSSSAFGRGTRNDKDLRRYFPHILPLIFRVQHLKALFMKNMQHCFGRLFDGQVVMLSWKKIDVHLILTGRSAGRWGIWWFASSASSKKLGIPMAHNLSYAQLLPLWLCVAASCFWFLWSLDVVAFAAQLRPQLPVPCCLVSQGRKGLLDGKSQKLRGQAMPGFALLFGLLRIVFSIHLYTVFVFFELPRFRNYLDEFSRLLQPILVRAQQIIANQLHKAAADHWVRWNNGKSLARGSTHPKSQEILHQVMAIKGLSCSSHGWISCGDG